MQFVSGKVEFNACQVSLLWHNSFLVKVKVIPAPNMGHRAAPISISITLGHTSAKCSESYSRGLVHWQLRVFQLPFSILECRAPDKKAVGTILKVFGMTQPGSEPGTSRS